MAQANNRLPETRLLILPGPDATPNDRGHLFEVFVARLLESLGYEAPGAATVNVKSEGIELDIATTSRLDRRRVIVECKAYSRPLAAHDLTNFYGKLAIERLTEPNTLGLFVAVPGLTSDGYEKANATAAGDKSFIFFDAAAVVERLRSEKIICSSPVAGLIQSDPAVVITPGGTFSAFIEVDSTSGAPLRVICWAAEDRVDPSTIANLASSEYAQGLQVLDARASFEPAPPPLEAETHLLVRVRSSKEDFQYQYPAAPRFFLGRKHLLGELERLVGSHKKVFVFNAQSGWGKSSLALKFGEMVESTGGMSWVMDTRTATSPRYVVEVLQKIASDAVDAGQWTLGPSQSWASLPSAISTLSEATVCDSARRYMVFFDQFENVFRLESVTRSFRDLALAVIEYNLPIIIGFAWKTDLVGWTEGYPYQLRDDIRDNANVLIVEPFGPSEVTTLISRVERAAGARLIPDLRNRLREYGQGLPWLLKKLSDHTLRELRAGASQENLVSEALNVQNLFEADLAELDPSLRELLQYVARYAPVVASDVTERFNHEAVQSLVDRRLVVQIGDHLDTYWDTFRDYVNTGRVPVEDSYVLRQTPNSVGRLIRAVLAQEGSASVSGLAEDLETSGNVIFNLSRELRLMGVAIYEPLRVTIAPSILDSADREESVRKQIAGALLRHRAFSTFRNLLERGEGAITADIFAAALPRTFPAISVEPKTWHSYALVFLAWFEYSGLAARQGGAWRLNSEPDLAPRQRLLTAQSALRSRPNVPQEAPRRAIQILIELGAEAHKLPSERSSDRDAVRTLASLGAINVDALGMMSLADRRLVSDGRVVPQVLRGLLERVPGGRAGLQLLSIKPHADPMSVGEEIRSAQGASWTPASTHSIGGHFRAWAKAAGLPIAPPPRGNSRQRHQSVELDIDFDS